MQDLVPVRAGERRAVVRRHAGELDRIGRREEVAEETVAAANRLAHRALMESALTGVVRREAARVAPENEQVYDMICAAAGAATVQAISSMSRRY